MKTEQVRVLRIIEYVGEREWVEQTVLRAIQNTKVVKPNCTITAVTLTQYPEILEAAHQSFDKGTVSP
jgi:hypothetical protein